MHDQPKLSAAGKERVLVLYLVSSRLLLQKVELFPQWFLFPDALSSF